MTPTEERLAITIDAILGFYPTGDAGRDRQSAAVIAKALLDELDIERIEREAYERGKQAVDAKFRQQLLVGGYKGER